jgi:hypothetical protein
MVAHWQHRAQHPQHPPRMSNGTPHSTRIPCAIFSAQ